MNVVLCPHCGLGLELGVSRAVCTMCDEREPAKGRAQCAACSAASLALIRYWQKKGVPLSWRPTKLPRNARRTRKPAA